MNTDREMLEWAAKAAGILFRGYDEDYEDYSAYDEETDVNYRWNPRDDDGDALRLAVILKFGVNVTSLKWTDITYFSSAGRGLPYILEYHDSDPLAATRRAIVRAAAEIGRAMP